MEEQPDYNYGQWVQGIYRRVQETLVPRLDEVNATIRRPDRNDSIHTHYQRLILPFTCKGNGGTCLLGASVFDLREQQSTLDRRAVEECPA